MQGLTAQERVVELLRTLAEAREAWDGRADGEGVLLMPSMWREGSYAELEARLIDLRSEQRPLWWHVCHRYRFGETRVLTLPIIRRRLYGQTLPRVQLPLRSELISGVPPHEVKAGSKRAPCRVYQWSAEVDPALVSEGIDTLTASMYAGRFERIWLPAVVYDRMMGRLLKVAA